MLLNLQTVFYICTNLGNCKFVSKAWNEKNSSSSRKAVWLCYLKDGVAYITLSRFSEASDRQTQVRLQTPILRSVSPVPSSIFHFDGSFWDHGQCSSPLHLTMEPFWWWAREGCEFFYPTSRGLHLSHLCFPKTPGIRHLWPSCCRNRVKKSHLTFISCTSNCHDFTLSRFQNCHLELYNIQEDSRKKLLGDDSDDSTSLAFPKGHAQGFMLCLMANDYNSTKEHIHSDPLFS